MQLSGKELEDLSKQLIEIQAEIDHRKRLNPLDFFKPFGLQKDFLEDNSSLVVLFGGNRSGKTEIGSVWLNTKLDLKGNKRAWADAESFSDSVNIQQRKTYTFATKKKIAYGRYDDINGFTNRKLQKLNRSIVTFKSYDQGREAHQGEDLDYIWDDEEPPKQIFDEQRMRLIDRNGKMIITMTSLKGMTDLILSLYEGAQIIKSQYAPLVNEELPRIAEKDGVRFYFLWTTENPHIDQNAVLNMVKNMTKDEIKSRIYGIPLNLCGRIYPKFNPKVHVVNWDFIPDQKYTLYHILDPHDRKPWAMQWWVIGKTGTAYCIDEHPYKINFNDVLSDDKTYDDYAELIKEKERVIKSLLDINITRRIIDPNFGNKTIQLAIRQGGQAHTTPKKELEQRGFKFKDGIDALEAGHLQVREWLDWQANTSGEITKQPKMFFWEGCENTIRHLSRYERDDKSRAKDEHKDYSDTTRYLAMSKPIFVEVKNDDFYEEPKKVY